MRKGGSNEITRRISVNNKRVDVDFGKEVIHIIPIIIIIIKRSAKNIAQDIGGSGGVFPALGRYKGLVDSVVAGRRTKKQHICCIRGKSIGFIEFQATRSPQ